MARLHSSLHLRWHQGHEARNHPAQRQNLRARQRAHQHRRIRVLTLQARPHRSLPQSLLKAPATLLERVLLPVQQSESARSVWDDGAPDGIGGKFAVCSASRGERFHAVHPQTKINPILRIGLRRVAAELFADT